jgi:hypothetical protein
VGGKGGAYANVVRQCVQAPAIPNLRGALAPLRKRDICAGAHALAQGKKRAQGSAMYGAREFGMGKQTSFGLADVYRLARCRQTWVNSAHPVRAIPVCCVELAGARQWRCCAPCGGKPTLTDWMPRCCRCIAIRKPATRTKNVQCARQNKYGQIRPAWIPAGWVNEYLKGWGSLCPARTPDSLYYRHNRMDRQPPKPGFTDQIRTDSIQSVYTLYDLAPCSVPIHTNLYKSIRIYMDYTDLCGLYRASPSR